MTEDFASDMYLLRDLLLLAKNNGLSQSPEWVALNEKLVSLEQKAARLMAAVKDLQLAFNPANRDLMMGLWAASFVDPVDPPNGQRPPNDPKLSEADLIQRAKDAGVLLNDLFDDLKAPHRVAGDQQPQGEVLRSRIAAVSTVKGVAADLKGEYKFLGDNLDRLIAAFQKTGGGGGDSSYWPSNYVSSSSSSSSSSGPPP
jgi:hypothetical protein